MSREIKIGRMSCIRNTRSYTYENFDYGCLGFVGSHMVDYLLKNVSDVKIFATRRWRSKEDNIRHLFGNEQVDFSEVDLLDRGSLQRYIRISKKILFIILHKVFLNQVFLRMGLNDQHNRNNKSHGRVKNEEDGVCNPIILFIIRSLRNSN